MIEDRSGNYCHWVFRSLSTCVFALEDGTFHLTRDWLTPPRGLAARPSSTFRSMCARSSFCADRRCRSLIKARTSRAPYKSKGLVEIGPGATLTWCPEGLVRCRGPMDRDVCFLGC
jgi:hypothetical protein